MCGTLKRLWMCVFLFTATFSAFGQNGQFSGQVTDQSNAAVPNARIQVVNLDTLVKVETQTDGTGQYIAPFLPSGRYRIIVEATGFSTINQEITLAPGQAAVLNIQLTVAEAKSTVSVEEGGLAKVETENAQVSGTITEKELVGIGLNGRNFTQLISLAPGVSNQTGQDEAKVGVLGSAKYSVNGGRTEYNTFEIDGSDVLNVGINKDNSTLNVYPSLDAIQEVKVLTSNYGAMYGRSASGTTIVTTKSGGQQFHGDAYEFLRNEVFNARNYFDPGKSAPLYRRQDFGFTLGGPLFIPKIYNTKKDRTYFFYSEEFRLEKTPTSFRHAVPSLAERSGDFSDVCPNAPPGGVFKRSDFPDCPASNTANVNAQQIYPRNNLTSPSIAGIGTPLSRNGVAILASGIIPLPNATSGCNSTIGSCYNATVSPSTYWREELFRFDHDINSKVRLTFRYIHDAWDTTVLSPQWADIQNTFPTIQNRFFGPGTDMVLRTTQVFSPSLLNEVVVSYTNSHITLTDVNGPGANFHRPAALDQPCAPDPTNVARIQCPMGYLFNNGFGGKIPGLVIAGNNAAYGGTGFAVDAGYMPWEHTNPTYTLGDNVSKVVGKHTFQFGGQVTFFQRNQTNGPSGASTGDVQGILTFNNLRGFRSTGNAFADLLKNQAGTLTSPATGAIVSFQQESAQSKYHQRYMVAEPYFQDDWKVTQHLTFNLGLRWSLFGTFHDRGGVTYNWVPSAFDPSLANRVFVKASGGGAGGLFDTQTGRLVPLDLNNLDPRITNGLVRCGANGVPDSCMSGQISNFAPRIGFAWDPTGSGKLSIRGGYGVFYEHGTAGEANTGSLEGGAPRVLDMTQLNPTGWACIGGVTSGCTSTGAYPLNVTAIPTQVTWPYVQQWSMSVQRELPANMVAAIAYVGSKGTHLTTQLQLNQVAPIPPSQNPFGIHEPLITTGPNPRSVSAQGGDCAGAFNGSSFTLRNKTVITTAQPAAINLFLACYGAFGTDTFPDPNTFRRYRGMGQIYGLQNIADSHYNAMQFTLRRTQGPLELSLAYTFSHSIDDSSDRSDGTFVNSFDLKSNRASSNFDQRHLVNISYIYQFPFYRHTGSGVLRTLLGGWSLSGLTTFQSGTPFSVINGGSPTGVGVPDNAGVANGTGIGSYPDIVFSARTAPPAAGNNPLSFGPLLGNPGAFVAPRGLTFGNAGRNSLNNPGRLNFDMALLKSFPVLGERTIEFRAEAFNVFNHTQFRIYDPNLGNTGSNTISCYGGAKSNYSAAGGDGVDCLTGSAFLHPVNAHRPRTMQLGVKLVF